MDIYTLSIGKSALLSFLFSRKAPLFPSPMVAHFHPGAIESFAQKAFIALRSRSIETISSIETKQRYLLSTSLHASAMYVRVIRTQLYFKTRCFYDLGYLVRNKYND